MNRPSPPRTPSSLALYLRGFVWVALPGDAPISHVYAALCQHQGTQCPSFCVFFGYIYMYICIHAAFCCLCCFHGNANVIYLIFQLLPTLPAECFMK